MKTISEIKKELEAEQKSSGRKPPRVIEHKHTPQNRKKYRTSKDR